MSLQGAMRRRGARMQFIRVTVLAIIAALTAAAGVPPAADERVQIAGTPQENALRDGCKQRYATNRQKYNACIAGRSQASRDALIDGCYARYRLQRDKLRECLRY